MISIWNLLWIVPVSAAVGGFAGALFILLAWNFTA